MRQEVERWSGVQIAGGPRLPGARDVRVYATRSDWEAGRGDGGLGGSDIAAILGLSPSHSEWDVFASRKLGVNPVHSAYTKALFARGHREEPRILEDYQVETGSVVAPVSNVIVDAATAPLSVSPDSFVRLEGWSEWGVGEAKTDASPASRWGRSGTVIERWGPWARDIVREDYAAQCYAQLLATGLDYAVICVRRSMDDLRHYTLFRDDALLERMADIVSEWWERHIVQGEPPENDGSEACARAKARIYKPDPSREKKARQATDDEAAIAAKLAEVGAMIDALKEREGRLKADLIDRIGDGYGIEWAGGKALYIDIQGRQTADMKLLQQQYPDVYAAVSRTSEPSRQLRLYIKD